MRSLLAVGGPEHSQHGVELAERDPSYVLDLLQRLLRELRALVEDVPAHARLHHHHVDRMTERVVQLPGETCPLFEHDPVVHGVLLPRLGRTQLAAIVRRVPEERSQRSEDRDGDERADIDRAPIRDGVRGHGDDQRRER